MHLCADLERWEPPVGPWPARVRHVALPWSCVAEHVTHRDASGHALRLSLREAGLALATIELPPLDCLGRDAFERQTEDAYMRMQIADRLGAEAVTLVSAHSGSVGFDAMVDVVRRLAVLAERIGIRVFVRNVNGSSIEQPESVARLLSLVGSSAVAACLDNVEFQRAVANPADAVLVLSGHIGAVRLGDERSGVPCAAGQGAAHVEATVEAMREEAFDGFVLVGGTYLAEADRLLFGAV